MAQKELLPLVVLLLILSLTSIALAEEATFSSEDLQSLVNARASEDDEKWITEMANGVKEQAKENLEQNFTEISTWNEKEYKRNFALEGYSLRVFVSSSMGKTLLKAYARQAAKYNAVLVFNGLPNGSWAELAKLISELDDGKTEFAAQIDDPAFEEFAITSVPSFVLTSETDCGDKENCSASFDKVSGNIGIRAALELFVNQGDLAREASRILNKGGSQ